MAEKSSPKSKKTSLWKTILVGIVLIVAGLFINQRYSGLSGWGDILLAIGAVAVFIYAPYEAYKNSKIDKDK